MNVLKELLKRNYIKVTEETFLDEEETIGDILRLFVDDINDFIESIVGPPYEDAPKSFKESEGDDYLRWTRIVDEHVKKLVRGVKLFSENVDSGLVLDTKKHNFFIKEVNYVTGVVEYCISVSVMPEYDIWKTRLEATMELYKKWHNKYTQALFHYDNHNKTSVLKPEKIKTKEEILAADLIDYTIPKN